MPFQSNQALAELRHQIAAAIDGSLAVSVEPKNATDTANAAAYVAQKKAVKVVAGAFVDGDPIPQGQSHLFHNWITSGGGVIPSATLPDFILGLVGQAIHPSAPNQKGG